MLFFSYLAIFFSSGLHFFIVLFFFAVRISPQFFGVLYFLVHSSAPTLSLFQSSMGEMRDWDADSRHGGLGQKTPPEPIAIVGMGVRLPGGVNSPSSLWDLLINKKNGRCLVPPSRYNVDAFYKPTKTTGSVASRYGYFLQDDVAKFDASCFSMSKAEVERTDPHHRLLLEVAWECMESAGQQNWRGGNIGCYVGVFGDVSFGTMNPIFC